MTDPKSVFNQLDREQVFKFLRQIFKTQYSVGDFKLRFDKKTFDDYTKFLEDEKQNINDLVEEVANEAARNKAGP